ncbi:MAG TPA: DUF6760 family protein [Thermoanaerobaculia bacterium]
MRDALRGGDERRGGVLGYPLAPLYEEVAFVAFHFHWPLERILELEHPERRRWEQEISAINQRLNGD